MQHTRGSALLGKDDAELSAQRIGAFQRTRATAACRAQLRRHD
jgi:hypothetical protein